MVSDNNYAYHTQCIKQMSGKTNLFYGYWDKSFQGEDGAEKQEQRSDSSEKKEEEERRKED